MGARTRAGCWLMLLVVPMQVNATPSVCPVQDATLVLSGGGAKGIAHIGLIRALDDLGIRPRMVIGTSMGALVGAMYASGYSGAELDSLVRTIPLEELFRFDPRSPTLMGGRPALVQVSGSGGRAAVDLPLVRESQLNALLSSLLLRGNLTAAGDFDALPVRFRAIATDMSTRESVALSSGDLAQAVRASLSLPFVLTPVEIGGRWLIDGAVSANIPTRAALESGAGALIISDVTRARSANLHRPGRLAALRLLFASGHVPVMEGSVLIRPQVEQFSALDFTRQALSALIDLGYSAAIAALLDAGCAASSVRPLPEGGSPHDLSGVLTQRATDLLQRSASREYEQLWLSPSRSGDSIVFAPVTTEGARWTAALGAAYDSDLGVQGWVGLVERRLLTRRAVGSATVTASRLGQELDLTVRAAMWSAQAVPLASVRLARFNLPGTGGALDARGTDVQTLLGVGAEDEALAWRIGAVARYMNTRNLDARWSAGVAATFKRAGRANAPEVTGSAQWLSDHARVHLAAAWPVQYDRLRVTPGFRLGAGRNLSDPDRFMLGGTDGFPGIRTGTVRDEREATVFIRLQQQLLGPASLSAEVVAARREGAAGGSVAGAGAGLLVASPWGPVYLHYGRSRGHGRLHLRVGAW